MSNWLGGRHRLCIGTYATSYLFIYFYFFTYPESAKWANSTCCPYESSFVIRYPHLPWVSLAVIYSFRHVVSRAVGTLSFNNKWIGVDNHQLNCLAKFSPCDNHHHDLGLWTFVFFFFFLELKISRNNIVLWLRIYQNLFLIYNHDHYQPQLGIGLDRTKTYTNHYVTRASLHCFLITAASPIPASYLADRIGTKKTLLLASVPYIIGWILVMFAGNVPTIYASRLISGLGYGIAYTTAPMYLGEIASDDVRGAMATLITVMSKVSLPPELRS